MNIDALLNNTTTYDGYGDKTLLHVRINTSSPSWKIITKDMKDSDDVLEVCDAIEENLKGLGFDCIISLDDQITSIERIY